MANSDYIKRGAGVLCSSAELLTAITPGDTTLSLGDFADSGVYAIEAGQAILVGSEIMRLETDYDATVTVARGCADTIPAAWPIGTVVWFFDKTVGTDGYEYVDSEKIGVKALVKTISGPMKIADAPAMRIRFSGRFARPYAPGKVLVNGLPWWDADARIELATPSLDITWAHRDRITQANILVDHSADSIGPEPEVQYVIRVYRASDDSLRRSETGIEGTTWSYLFAEAIVDLGVDLGGSDGDVAGYIELSARRTIHESWQRYRIPFIVNADDADASGWSGKWDGPWGTT